MTEFDVAIVGGGPAGMAAAAEMAGTGVSAVVIDSYHQLGGHYYRQPPPSFAPHPIMGERRQHEFEALLAQSQHPRVKNLFETSVWAAFIENDVFVLHLAGHHSRPEKSRISSSRAKMGENDSGALSVPSSVSTKMLLAAPGAYDRPLPFPGWHLPGVMTLGGAQMLLKGHGILPGKRILVGGSGPLLLAAAAGLVKAGADVVAVLDAAGLFDGTKRSPLAFWGQWGRLREAWDYARTLQRAGVPVHFGQTIFQAQGDGQVETARYGPVDADGRPHHSKSKTIELDTICAAHGFLPNIALTRMLKCEHRYDERLDAYYPAYKPSMESSVPNLFVAGDVTGVGGKDLSKMQGQIAAWHILEKLGALSADETERRCSSLARAIASEHRFLDMMCERMRIQPGQFDLMDDETVVCRCEMVTVGHVKRAVAQGASDLRGMKLRTRCGMGACQSRYCEQTTAQIIMRETGKPREAVGTSSIRPPLIPVQAKELY
ncbi:NAD(P)/FAD-dependent oxidoreductase [Chloroflexi bacterium TSY]|nr:NAD(P)/FAD-dependent oxidoreductase [Chloroflexi bacterium TSY]